MKKIFILIVSVAFCAMPVCAQFGQRPSNAQNTESGQAKTSNVSTSPSGTKSGKGIDIKKKHYNYEFSIGPQVGVGVSTMSESDGLSVYDGSGIGFGGGIAANVRFGSKNKRGQYLDGQGLFGIGLELNYKSHSVKMKDGNDDLNLGYFEVPVLLQFYPLYNSKQLKNLYIEVGPTIAGTMSSSPEKIVVEKATYKTEDIKGFDVKATIGLGYRFNKTSANDGFYVNARYYLGTSKLAGNFPAKLSSAELSIGYIFKCIGTKK